MKNENKQNEFVKKTVIVSAMLLVILVFAIIIGVISWPERTLNSIERNIERGNYAKAENLITEYEARFDYANLVEYKQICNYNLAVEALNSGDQDEAGYRLSQYSDYRDSKELLKECRYMDAIDEIEDQSYEDAYTLLSQLTGYKDVDEKIKLCRYEIAKITYTEGDLGKALDMFLSLNEYADAKTYADTIAMQVTGTNSVEDAYQILEGMDLEEMQKIARLTEIRAGLPSDIIAVGSYHTVGLKDDGTVLAVGQNDKGQCDVDMWSNVVAVSAGAEHTVALSSDGKVYAAGSNESGQCDVSIWTDVVEIAAGQYTTFGLRSDGTILIAGMIEIDTAEFTDIKTIGAGAYGAVFIDSDGAVSATHPSFYLSDMGAIQIDASTGYAIALMPDGTAVSSIECTEKFEDIITLSAGANMILGIKSDGTLAMHVFRNRDSFELDASNIIAVSAGGAHSGVVLSDGSVLCFGENDYGQCDVSEWDLILND